MCTGRIDLAFVLRALSKGADGVFIAGCHLKECNYLTQGNYYALSMVSLCKKLLGKAGVNPERLQMRMVSGGEAGRFADSVNSFSEMIRTIGPIGIGEEGTGAERKATLESISRLVPYIKLAMREKLAVQLPDEDSYKALYSDEEIERLLQEAPSYYIIPEKCQACMMCAKRCPVEAIEGGKNRIHVIDQDKCIKCGQCFETCPPRFDAVTKLTGEPVPPPLGEDQRAIDRRGKGP